MPLDQQAKLYKDRRKQREYWHGYPWWKRVLSRLEAANKRLSLGLVKRILGVRHVEGPLDPATVRSILFLRNDAMGDMILTTPLWHVLKRHHPHIRVGVIGSFRNLSVVEHDPNIEEKFDATPGEWKQLLEARKRIRRQQWDVIMPMIYNGKTRMAFYCRLLAPGSISSMLIRPGESREDRSKLFSLIVQSPYNGGEVPMLEQMKVHLTGTVALTFNDSEWTTRLYTDSANDARVTQRVGEIMQRHGTSGFIHVNLEARTEFREYGIEKSYAVSSELAKRFPNLSILWTSSPAAANRAMEYLAQRSSARLEYYQTGDLQELASLVARATLVISPDTGVIHVAAAFQRPIVGLYVEPNEWPPHRTEYRLLFPAKGEPVSTIPVEDVTGAAVEMIGRSDEVSPSE